MYRYVRPSGVTRIFLRLRTPEGSGGMNSRQGFLTPVAGSRRYPATGMLPWFRIHKERPSGVQARGISPGSAPETVLGSPPATGKSTAIWSLWAATHAPSGEIVLLLTFTPSGEMGLGAPPPLSRTKRRESLPCSFPRSKKRWPSGNQSAHWTDCREGREIPRLSPAPVGRSRSLGVPSSGSAATHLPSGESPTARPSPKRTGTEPSVFLM